MIALALATSCRKAEREPSQAREAAPSRITPEEADRGRKACESYVDQVCDCALKVPDLTSECDMARSRPKALDMNLRAAMAEGNATERDRLAIQANAAQIARACIEDSAALVVRGCEPPRSGASPAKAPERPEKKQKRPGSGPVPAPPPEPERIQDPTR
jgi:hypothetical protein